MRKDLRYSDLSPDEAQIMEEVLYNEIKELDNNHPIRLLLNEAILDYKIGLCKYDGPTFSKVYKNFWEVPAFIHDWRNSMGYVSYKVDKEMFSMMILLNYPIRYIEQRWMLTRLTFINMFIKYIQGKIKKLDKIELYLL